MGPIPRSALGLALAFAFASPAFAGNYAACIIDKMPGTQNGATHAAVVQSCGQEHPARYSGVRKGDGRGLFGFSDGNACTIKKAASTSYQPAAGAIAFACRCLYDKPQSDGQTCANFFDQFDN